MNVNQIRRRSLDLWLQSVRLPLTLTEAVVGRSDENESWPPAVAFATFEGTVKEFVGRMTHDETLVEVANLQRAEITQRQRAAELRAEAAATADKTRRHAEEEHARLERQREEADEQTREAQHQVEVERQNAKRVLERTTATKRTANKATAATWAKTIDKAATKAEADRLRKEAQALRAKKQAVRTQGDVVDLDKAVRAKKAARRAN